MISWINLKFSESSESESEKWSIYTWFVYVWKAGWSLHKNRFRKCIEEVKGGSSISHLAPVSWLSATQWGCSPDQAPPGPRVSWRQSWRRWAHWWGRGPWPGTWLSPPAETPQQNTKDNMSSLSADLPPPSWYLDCAGAVQGRLDGDTLIVDHHHALHFAVAADPLQHTNITLLAKELYPDLPWWHPPPGEWDWPTPLPCLGPPSFRLELTKFV